MRNVARRLDALEEARKVDLGPRLIPLQEGESAAEAAGRLGLREGTAGRLIFLSAADEAL